MRLIDYLKTMPRNARAELAIACGTTIGHLNNVAYGFKSSSPALSLALEEQTAGAVTRKEMRADWHSIWPDLRGCANPQTHGEHVGVTP